MCGCCDKACNGCMGGATQPKAQCAVRWSIAAVSWHSFRLITCIWTFDLVVSPWLPSTLLSLISASVVLCCKRSDEKCGYQALGICTSIAAGINLLVYAYIVLYLMMNPPLWFIFYIPFILLFAAGDLTTEIGCAVAAFQHHRQQIVVAPPEGGIIVMATPVMGAPVVGPQEVGQGVDMVQPADIEQPKGF